MEIVMDYLNHKVIKLIIIIIQYYWENMKDIQLVINEDYQLEPESALDVYIASIKLEL